MEKFGGSFPHITHCEKFRDYVMKSQRLKWKTEGGTNVCCVAFYCVQNQKNVIDKVLLLHYTLFINQRRLTKWKLKSNYGHNSFCTTFITVSVISVRIKLKFLFYWMQDGNEYKIQAATNKAIQKRIALFMCWNW